MADIFLSYANEDRETARAVAGLLESAGCTVWWDRRIPAGRTWRSMIEEALRDMRCMVVLWSTHSVDSDWVKEEAEEARAVGKLIPVLIEPVKPPVGFRSIQAADLVDWDGSRDSLGARQLIADLQSLMSKPAQRRLAQVEDSHRENQPISASRGEDARVIDETAISNENSRLGGSPPVPQIGSTSLASERKPAVGWKPAAAGVLIVIAVLGSLLWFGKKERPSGPQVATLKPPPVPAPGLVSLGLSGDRQEIGANETLSVTLKGQYSDGKQKNINEGVKWLSSEPRVATIDDQGRVTARQAGETKITAQYGDLVSPAWTLTVRAEKPVLTVTLPAEKPVVKTPAATQLVALTIAAARREVKTQERLPLRVKARYSDGNEKGISSGVEWRSSDTSIASVDSRGELLALRSGKIAVVARWGGIESLALDIVVRESPMKPPQESSTYRPAIEPPQVTPAKPPVQTINIASYINRAKGYRVQGNYAAALAELEKARTISPGSQEVLDEIEATKRACNAEKRLGREGLEC
ncbi:MAG TPA: TIR domain-containing protein [Candidatus Binatia bacterium]|nr:TIR domain-containing protein [Candidatus Binatia bacterium]